MLPCLELPLDSVSKLVYEEALFAAHALGREADVRAILERVDAMAPGAQPPTIRGHALRFRALLGEEPDERFRAAAALFREYGIVLTCARIQLEHAAWLSGEGRDEEAEALRAEAQAVFEQRNVRPWLEPLDAVPSPLARIAAETT